MITFTASFRHTLTPRLLRDIQFIYYRKEMDDGPLGLLPRAKAFPYRRRLDAATRD